ncbi:hypothetical protein OROGR_030320 [Orobanche gracilis]
MVIISHFTEAVASISTSSTATDFDQLHATDFDQLRRCRFRTAPPIQKNLEVEIIVQIYMATFSGLILNFSGIKSLPIGANHAKMPFPSHNHGTFSFSKSHCSVAIFSRKIPNHPFQYFHQGCSRTTKNLSSRRNYQLDYEDDTHTQPFWLNFIREAI